MKTLTTLMSLLLLSLSSNSIAEPVLRPFTAHYSVSKSGIEVGTTQLSLHENNGHWVLVSETEAIGLLKLIKPGKIIERSDLNMTEEGMKLRRYEHKEEERGGHRQAVGEADWAGGTLDFNYRGKIGKASLVQPPLYDRLSSMLGVMQALSEDKREVALQVFDGDEIKQMRFEASNGELLSTPMGEIQALLVKRIRDNSSRKTLTWYAPSLNFLPVKIEQFKRGELVGRLEITSID